MTDGHLTDDHMVDGHLNDEQLSSHLDGLDAGSGGERDRDVAASIGSHLEGCARCRRRLVALEAVRLRLRGSVESLSPRVRADSIDAVLRAVRDGDAEGTASGAVPERTPIPLARRRPQALVGAAAAILVLAGAVGIPLALSHSGTTAASRAPSGAVSPPASATSGAVENGVQVFSDLGTFSSAGALEARVEGLLPVASAAVPTGPAPAPTYASPATSTATNAGAGAGTASGPASGNGHVGSNSTTESGKAVQGPLDFRAAGPTTRAQIDGCLSAAMHAAGPGRTLQVAATATFRGTPAVVYVFGSGSGASTSATKAPPQLVATARNGCRVLTKTPL